MIWAYLIHLGQNFWNEFDSDPSFLGRYYPELVCEDDAWRQVTDHIKESGFNTLLIDLGEGLKYDTHPELAIPGSWSKNKLYDELKRLRSIGLDPVPKLNFSTCHDAWLQQYARMVSTPTYYKVVKDLIDEVSELFETPHLIHVGMDEEAYNPMLPYYCIEMQPKMGSTCVRNREIMWGDIQYTVDLCEKNGSRAWIWADQGWFVLDDMLKNMPKSALLSNALYARMLNPHLLSPWSQASLESYKILAEHGFKQVPTCSCTSNYLNGDDTMALLKDLDGIEGYMMAPWYRTREIDVLKHKACAKTFGIAKNKYYGDKK